MLSFDIIVFDIVVFYCCCLLLLSFILLSLILLSFTIVVFYYRLLLVLRSNNKIAFIDLNHVSMTTFSWQEKWVTRAESPFGFDFTIRRFVSSTLILPRTRVKSKNATRISG